MSNLREAAQQALEALEQAHPKPYNEDVRAHVEAITALRAALEQPEQEPVACFIGIKGGAFDLPTTKRAYTYEEQPGNVVASKLGQALETAKCFPPGDSIDAGLVLLKTLQAEGFGVFQLGAEYTAPFNREWQSLTDQEVWDAVQQGVVGSIGLPSKAIAVARAIEAALKERNT